MNGAPRLSPARPDRQPEGAVRACIVAFQERKRRVYCVSCSIEPMSAAVAAPPMSSREPSSARSTTRATSTSSCAITRRPSVCPSGTRRTPAETTLATKACANARAVRARSSPCAAAAVPTATG